MPCKCTAITDAAFLDLQNLAELERVHLRGSCGEMWPAYSHDAYQETSIKAEVPSDAEAEDPLAITFPGRGIKAEPEVRCVSVSMLGRFHKYRSPSLCRQSMRVHLLHRTTSIRKK